MQKNSSDQNIKYTYLNKDPDRFFQELEFELNNYCPNDYGYKFRSGNDMIVDPETGQIKLTIDYVNELKDARSDLRSQQGTI